MLKRMKTENMNVLLYLKKSGLDKSGKAPIMGRITIGRFHCPVQLQVLLLSQLVKST